MKLDSSIETLLDILTCFDIEEASQFMGQKGYFADVYSSFRNLSNRAYGTLTEIKDSDCPFKMDNNEYWCFFIPESRLLKTKQKKSKYVPFETLNDLRDYKIRIGDVIQIRPFDAQDVQYSTIVTNIAFEHNTEELIDIALGAYTYSFTTLCNHYLFLLDNAWVPFGKRVEE